MSGNAYGDLIAPWKVRLIARQARRFGFRPDEISDLQQRIVPHLLDAAFDPNRSDGGSERTFVRAVIDRHLMKVIRDQRRDVRRANHGAVSLQQEPTLTELDFFARDPWETIRLRLDVAQALEGLTDVERAICLALGSGSSQADIARATGRSKAAISGEVARLRKKLRAWGLDAYVEEDDPST